MVFGLIFILIVQITNFSLIFIFILQTMNLNPDAIHHGFLPNFKIESVGLQTSSGANFGAPKRPGTKK